ncbi:hypothetical protein KW787_04165 [Candidatus Pacearchaeota archaeon]|nr:hypothetical protein [Candidatus Pacearchaeota archaeon]
MKVRLDKITTKGKALYLAYDQGMEHGPIEFNDENVDPESIISLAQKGKYTAMIFQKGIAEKYSSSIKKSKIPLIVKLNGKTSLYKGDPISRQLCTVKEAIQLGASAVGYTIYIGSEQESTMLQEFEKIEREAHAKGIPVVAWIYPRGKATEGKPEGELMVYAARIGLEIGADVVKLKYNRNEKDLAWAVKSAGKTKIVISGGSKVDERVFLKEVKETMEANAFGVAVGRNVWQHKNPLEMTKKIKEIIFS